MATTRCTLCGARKARRSCPALAKEICPVCCGTKRIVEISCPASCTYLQSAKTHPAVAVRRREERELRFLASSLRATSDPQRALFAFLQSAIVQHARTSTPAVVDRDVAEAVGALAATFETAAKGLIYEQQPASIPAQRLARDLRERIETTLRPAERPVDRDLAVALRRTQTCAATAAAQIDGGETAYLDFLGRRMAAGGEAPHAAAVPSPLIITP